MAKGTFQVVLTVEPALVPLAVASPEDLGPVGGPLVTTALGITGGTPPYTVTLDPASGPLPEGVGLNADGTFSGTPTTAGSFTVTVDVADSLG